MRRRVVWQKFTDVSEGPVISIFLVLNKNGVISQNTINLVTISQYDICAFDVTERHYASERVHLASVV
jgi:hypothetical protein